jgi:hypothetical protein
MAVGFWGGVGGGKGLGIKGRLFEDSCDCGALASRLPGSNPVDLQAAAQQFGRETPRCFRYDLRCANYGVNRLSVGPVGFEVEIRGKGVDGIYVVNDIGLAGPDS